MTVFDLDELVLKNRRLTALTNLRYRKSDRLQWPLRFLQDESFVELPVGASLSVGVKRTRNSNSYLALATSPAKTGTGSTTIYTFDLNLNTEPVSYELSDKETIDCVLEVEIVTPTQRLTSQSVPLVIERDVIANDPAPVAIPDLKATQAEAEAGTDNGKWMTPFLTAQAIAALAGGGSFILKQASFQAESGKRYLVGVSPDGGGTSGGDASGGSSDGSGGSVGSAETEVIITLPANPQPADAIVILDAFGNWSQTRFGQSTIPAVLQLNGHRLDGSVGLYNGLWGLMALPCSCILTFAGRSVGWHITRIETGRELDLGYGSRLDLCKSYPDGVILTNTSSGYPRFIVWGYNGQHVSIGVANDKPVIEASGNAPLRIGQQPQLLRARGFVTLDGSKIEVPFYGTQDCKLATYAGATTGGNGLEEGALRYNTVHGRPEILVKNARPLTLTLTGTTHHLYANTFTLNGTYIWNVAENRWNGNPLPTPYATKDAPVYQNWSGVLPAQIRYVNWTKWAIFVNNVEYAYLLWPGNAVYPPLAEQFPYSNLTWKLTATNEETDFLLSYDTSLARWIPLDGSGV
ncbi:MAG: hypothetical protein IAE97_01575 [Chthoniobacterales bacterium]|nr:hypothetical protein [Chthoniobacterales bacterium]